MTTRNYTPEPLVKARPAKSTPHRPLYERFEAIADGILDLLENNDADKGRVLLQSKSFGSAAS